MFRHKGNARTLIHNLQIASLLSFVAGIVNVIGFLAVQRLTTNVTGHFAFFVDEFYKLNFFQGFLYLLYILFFLFGSFVSNFLVEYLHKRKESYVFAVPGILEALLLLIASFWQEIFSSIEPDYLAFLLLFTMGLQNSLVTSISNATVRTTHLTGLFTDLGIELSQLFFYKQIETKKKLYSSIFLRLTIISFFFIGGVISGILYSQFGLHVMLLATAVLLIGITFDYWKLKLIRMKRKH
ncbi:MAG: DUF1275 domain-containing protein [Bacteroidia bacterium]|nr:DUF1275 domain-containing protein [Bacteroidia bacterium]MCC7533629.1 DUF1275 domain-containing protein [Bacteroidia bacterium]